jgi:hypothetical protein
MSFRVSGNIFKNLKIKLIKNERTFQNLIENILIEYLDSNLNIREINGYKNPIDKKLLEKTLTFRIDEKAYKEIKLKLIRKETSFQEEIEKFILAYLDDNLFLRDGGRI